MKIAIMQPYFFPYIGYFQLINAVNKFVIYDDVNYIKSGWINRNKILINGKPSLFTLPLSKISSFKLINELKIDRNNYELWKTKFLKKISQAYANALYLNPTFKLINNMLNIKDDHISTINTKSIITISNYLGINTYFVPSSTVYKNSYLKGYDRIIDICKKEKASQYVNPIGGKNLYQKENFAQNNIKLNFLNSKKIVYNQYKNDFLPNLSIIDVMMFNSKDTISVFLNEYELL